MYLFIFLGQLLYDVDVFFCKLNSSGKIVQNFFFLDLWNLFCFWKLKAPGRSWTFFADSPEQCDLWSKIQTGYRDRDLIIHYETVFITVYAAKNPISCKQTKPTER